MVNVIFAYSYEEGMVQHLKSTRGAASVNFSTGESDLVRQMSSNKASAQQLSITLRHSAHIFILFALTRRTRFAGHLLV